MLDPFSRRQIMDAMGSAVDSLVRDLYHPHGQGPSMIQEPEISSRICQRLEDRLDGKRAGQYVFHIKAQSLPDRGPGSLERITGADIFIAFSLDGPDGFDKGLFVQAKYDNNVKREDLIDACRRMERQSDHRGGQVWIYKEDGVDVFSAGQIRAMTSNSLKGMRPRSVAGLTGRILDCHTGSQQLGVAMGPDRREEIWTLLAERRVQNGVDIVLKSSSKRT